MTQVCNYTIKFLFVSFAIFGANYAASYFLFGSIVINSHDTLEIIVPQNKVLSDLYRYGFDYIDVFLNGNLSWTYFDRIFNPLLIIYFLADLKSAYFTETILFKFFAFWSFYQLSKTEGLEKSKSIIVSCLYAVLVTRFYTSSIIILFYPYLYLLICRNKILKINNILFLIFCGLNSSLVYSSMVFPFLILSAYIFNKEKINFKKLFLIFLIINIAIIITNFHLFINLLDSNASFRSEFVDSQTLVSQISESINKIFLISSNFKDINIIFDIFPSLLFIYILQNSFFSEYSSVDTDLLKIRKIFFTIAGFFFISIILNNFSFFLVSYFTDFPYINLGRLIRLHPFLYCLIILFYLKKKEAQSLILITIIVAIFSLQAKDIFHESAKIVVRSSFSNAQFNEIKNKLKDQDYLKIVNLVLKTDLSFDIKSNKKYIRNYDNFFKHEDYKFIKKITGNYRIISIGLDPMAAATNGIKVVDGYHVNYPLFYKREFRKIIKKELDKNVNLKRYYDNWGARVYAFYNDENNIDIDFRRAKEIGATFVLSKFSIINSDLETICIKCNNLENFNLYRIK